MDVLRQSTDDLLAELYQTRAELEGKVARLQQDNKEAVKILQQNIDRLENELVQQSLQMTTHLVSKLGLLNSFLPIRKSRNHAIQYNAWY